MERDISGPQTTRDDLDECWCCGGLHDSLGLLCPSCRDAGCQYFDGECRSDHKPVLPDGGYRHATDRKETVVVAGCPNGCQALELESSGETDAVDELVETVKEAFGECSDCGAEIGFLRKEEPKEVLE